MVAVNLREFREADADALFDWMRDPSAVRMAAFTAADLDDRQAFDAHHRRNLANPSVLSRAVDVDGEFVGSIASFDMGDQREITYWIDPARWGQGIASEALAQFLQLETTRPLHARAATANGGSARVLERHGFVRTGVNRGHANGAGGVIEETLFELRPWRVRPLEPETWEVFAELVERNNGVFGGCWCMGHHPSGDGPSFRSPETDNRATKMSLVQSGQAHAALVVDADGVAQGWAKYGRLAELPTIEHNRRAYDQDRPPPPDWRITCFYTDTRHRRSGVGRAALEGALDLIAREGGGVVEALPESTAGRNAQGRFLFEMSLELYEDYGFARLRQIGKHRWIVRKVVGPDDVRYRPELT